MELNSILPNYQSWPYDIKEKLIKSIKNTELVCKKIKENIEKEFPIIDEVLRNLTEIYQTFLHQNDSEYLSKDKNFFYNHFFKKIPGQIDNNTSNDEFIKKIYNSIPSNFERNIDEIFYSILNNTQLENKIYTKGIIDLYKKQLIYKAHHDKNVNDEYINNAISVEKIKNIGENAIKIRQWLIVAKNFYFCINNGIRLYKTIQLSKKFERDNVYQKRLDKISEEFERYRSFKQLDKDDLFKSSEIIIDSFRKLEKIRNDLLYLIEDLKQKIDENNSKKEEDRSSYFYNGIKLFYNLCCFAANNNPNKFFNVLNTILAAYNMAITASDISYLNEIIDQLIQVLKDSYTKKIEVEEEMKLLYKPTLELRKAYPK